jgi:hypothetical protein
MIKTDENKKSLKKQMGTLFRTSPLGQVAIAKIGW